MAERSIAADCKSAGLCPTLVRIQLPPPLLIQMKNSILKISITLILFLSFLNSKTLCNDNTFYFKLIDSSGIAPFNDNIVLQYERHLFNKIYLLTELSQENETIQNIGSVNEGFAIGLSIPSLLRFRPYVGYKYLTKKYNPVHNKKNEPVSNIFTQLNYNYFLDDTNIIVLYARLLIEKIESDPETKLNYDIGLSYGYTF